MECRNILIQLLNGNQSKIKQELETTIEDYGALYLGLQKTHPISATLCPAWLDIIRYYWQHITMEGPRIITGQSTLFEAFLLQGLLLVKETIKYASSKQKIDDDILLSVTEEEKELTIESHRLIHQHFLTPEFVSRCAETLVSQYMLLTPRDFQKWEEDPEGWANDLDSENWEFELRPCAEMTFMSLLNNYKDQLIPILLNLVERVATVTDQPSLLFKDAVYGAIGLGVHSLYGRLDFEPFVMNRLVVELRENKENPNFRILRRRIGWMLGKWVNEGISADCRKVIYEILLELMAENEDLVVRLTAANGLKQAVDDWDFDISIVLPYLGTAMSLLMNLLNQVEESDTIMKLISYLNAIMDRTGSDMIPYAGQIIQLLTPLWSPTIEPLLQSSLVVTFTKITSILNEQSTQLHTILIPIIRYCTDRNNEAHIYLLEDSLDLWWTMLQTSPHSSSEIMSLLFTALELLDYDTENLRKILKIIESYLLLDPQTTLQHSLILFTKLASKIENAREHVVSYIVHTTDLALQSGPLQIYGESLVQSGLLTRILTVLVEEKMYGYTVMNYMNIFSRLSIYDASFVIQVIQLVGQQRGEDENFLGHVFDTWLDKVR
ncbi:armadillo-type protein [Cokeromyces recurvatus]|uniref:armadillo-type protein n=1 Tax=Cokeromyces recurvatus TaxID=90255 RepID=UPI00222070BB|nr:armadillo-type protein [Cokeromyces recurvatus]KAI7902236.1 armadillo-type protein [Cokeromyces recurvatus]